jgi:hypothetical protein
MVRAWMENLTGRPRVTTPATPTELTRNPDLNGFRAQPPIERAYQQSSIRAALSNENFAI